MKILTANIALGLKNANRFSGYMRGMGAFHGLASFLVAILCPPLRGLWGGPEYSAKRLKYLQQHKDLSAVFRIISQTAPDIIILNEVIPEVHKPELDQTLKQMGFVVITYGLGAKYSDAHVSTMVATKQNADIIPVNMPQLPYPGCGGGIAGLRLKSGVSLIGAHMALGGTSLWHKQLSAITAIIQSEEAYGNKIIFAGDCNEIEKFITPSFSKLDIISVDKRKTPTCPIILPHIFWRSLDHIYVSNAWKVRDFHALSFSSDHLAIYAEITE